MLSIRIHEYNRQHHKYISANIGTYRYIKASMEMEQEGHYASATTYHHHRFTLGPLAYGGIYHLA